MERMANPAMAAEAVGVDTVVKIIVIATVVPAGEVELADRAVKVA